MEIIQLGNPILRSQAEFVENIDEPQIQQLIDDLLITVKQTNGVGIAAPQVGVGDRIFIVASRPNPRYPHAPEMEPTPMINPKISARSSESVKGWEGCLSIPGIRGSVPRDRAIEVEYSDRYGKLHKQELSDFVARIFQHELDHLDGIVFLDRLETNYDLITEQEYQKLVSG
ncbi:MAG: Peptide deformylase [Chroococcidiopsis sp. SAG 2025]|uniref:peptide deformylase n=1 Tax=Chroococcidiopsis sp. SAG 2025 TaxID=171389 RepID=UPI002936D8D8|nr:peptide deformylase [Chroococcidiopsis sp. SAG 2025]MDV2996729.1 Peptide deformylase [Chroococcidiopsis sp. SAG 2025]